MLALLLIAGTTIGAYAQRMEIAGIINEATKMIFILLWSSYKLIYTLLGR